MGEYPGYSNAKGQYRQGGEGSHANRERRDRGQLRHGLKVWFGPLWGMLCNFRWCQPAVAGGMKPACSKMTVESGRCRNSRSRRAAGALAALATTAAGYEIVGASSTAI